MSPTVPPTQMARATEPISGQIVAGESMDSDRLKAKKLLQVLTHLRSSESSLMKASEPYISMAGGSDETAIRLHLHNAAASLLGLYKLKVAGELVEVLRKILEKEKIRCFSITNPNTAREVDFLVRFTKVLLSFLEAAPASSNDAVSVASGESSKGWRRIWEWISEFTRPSPA